MPQLISTTTMILRLSGMLDTRDLSEWEQQFVRSLVEKLDAGRVTSLTERQVETLERLHGRHFA
jgi:hypothetical protein